MRFKTSRSLKCYNEWIDRMLVYIKQRKRNKIYHNNLLRDLKFSFGYSFNKRDNEKTIDELIGLADDCMYADKAQNKKYRRRKDDR